MTFLHPLCCCPLWSTTSLSFIDFVSNSLLSLLWMNLIFSYCYLATKMPHSYLFSYKMNLIHSKLIWIQLLLRGALYIRFYSHEFFSQATLGFLKPYSKHVHYPWLFATQIHPKDIFHAFIPKWWLQESLETTKESRKYGGDHC